MPISSLTSNNQDQHLQPPTVKMITALAAGNIDLRKLRNQEKQLPCMIQPL